MPSNIEIKFRVDDLDAVEMRVVPLADHGPELLVQKDVYFAASSGRLKLRTFADGQSELVAYRRNDDDSIRESKWHAYATNDAASLTAALAMTVGRGVTVGKRRLLYIVGNTRVHLDQVESLGKFVELEVVLSNEDTNDMGVSIANELVDRLGLDGCERVSVSYADLLAAKM